MSKKKNRYQKDARKKHFLSGIGVTGSTKQKLVHAGTETGKDLLIGVLGGGFIGAALGKKSLWVGLLATGVGHYVESKPIQLLGIGMMAANGFQPAATTSGLDGLEGIKERIMAYRDTIKQKFYLDKIMKKTTAATNGIGDLQYFSYPDNMNGHLAALDDIEQQLADSAMEFQGINGAMNGEYDEMGEIEERLY